MALKQINLTLPENLIKSAKEYSKKFGFRNIQELATESMREKIFFQKEYDEEITPKETEIIDKFIDKTLKNKKLLATEEELDKALLG
jgi:hypothetical protein